jgi:hypothetical protein
LFDEVDEPDYNWRCRYSWLLFNCLYEVDNKKPEAIKVLDKLWDNTKKVKKKYKPPQKIGKNINN